MYLLISISVSLMMLSKEQPLNICIYKYKESNT